MSENIISGENSAREKDWHPCSREQGFCPSLRSRLKLPVQEGAGLFIVAVVRKDESSETHIKTEERIIGAMYRNDTESKGVMLNYCPFCGASIDWFRDKDSAVNEEKPGGEANEI